jgi:[ribosomal protein S5]-alanine N-acetyltransferase
MFRDPLDLLPHGSGASGRIGWPARLGPATSGAGDVELRPLQRSDGTPWRTQRIRDEALIAPWDASSASSWAARHTPGMWRAHRAGLALAARHGESMPFAITVAGRFAGQVTIGGIHRGALQSAWIGYWVDSELAGRGVATVATALATGHAFGDGGLHRLEATVAPENLASRAVLTHLGFRDEGLLRRYLHVGGAWHDHVLFALTREDVPGGTVELLARFAARRKSS